MPGQKIQIKVGQNKFNTTMATLCKSKTLEEAFGPGGTRPPFQNKMYHMDRDGDMFTYILRFLRTGFLSFPETFNTAERELLLQEASYYKLEDLQRAINVDRAGTKEIVDIQLLTPPVELQNDKQQLDVTVTANQDSVWLALEKRTISQCFIVQRSVNKHERNNPCEVLSPQGGWSLKQVFKENSERTTQSEAIFSATSDLVDAAILFPLLQIGFTLSKTEVQQNVTRKRMTYTQARVMTLQRVKPID